MKSYVYAFKAAYHYLASIVWFKLLRHFNSHEVAYQNGRTHYDLGELNRDAFVARANAK